MGLLLLLLCCCPFFWCICRCCTCTIFSTFPLLWIELGLLTMAKKSGGGNHKEQISKRDFKKAARSNTVMQIKTSALDSTKTISALLCFPGFGNRKKNRSLVENVKKTKKNINVILKSRSNDCAISFLLFFDGLMGFKCVKYN